MAEDKINEKKDILPEEIKEGKETKEFLARKEIRTMRKDVSKLQEAGAREERDRIAKLKTGEEERVEKEREQRARREAEERKKAEIESREKEKGLEEMKKEREKRIEVMTEEKLKKEELRAEDFKEKIQEVQTKEEEERRKFLERVESKAEGKETPLSPLPPVIPRPAPAPSQPLEKEKPEKLPEKPSAESSHYGPYQVLSKKPSFFDKLWIRAIVSLLVLAILAGIATFWYWYFQVRQVFKEGIQEEAPEEISPESPAVIEPTINERLLEWGYHIPDAPRLIDTIIIHSTYNVFSDDPHDFEGVIQEYQYYRVAAQYLIDRQGIIYRLALDEAVAYHAGLSQMPDGRENVNDFSIGIEIIQTKTESPNEFQYLALSQLVKYLQQEYEIPYENILGHKDVSPDRKTDPWNFDWEKFNQLIKS